MCELHIEFEITDPLIIDEKLAAVLKYLPDVMMDSGFPVTGLYFSKTIFKCHEDQMQQVQDGFMRENNIQSLVFSSYVV